MSSLKTRLISKLVAKKLATEEQIITAFDYQTVNRVSLREALLKLKILTERDLLLFLSDELDLPVLDLSKLHVDPAIAHLIPEELARAHCTLPIAQIGATLTVAMADPLNVLALDDIKALTKKEIVPVLALHQDILQAIEQSYGRSASQTIEKIVEDIHSEDLEFIGALGNDTLDEKSVRELANETPIVRVTEMLLEQAIRQQASDVLMEPLKQHMRIRYRLDGLWHEIDNFPRSMHESIVSRIKVMSELDIAERRTPQDGRFKVRCEGRTIDFRVSILPTVRGEKVALRLLDKNVVMLNLDKLGFDSSSLDNLKKSIRHPHGMVLMCGPTGSGKTTTLYSILKYIDSPEKNIVTVEDPVEYQIEGINQTAVRHEIGFSFSRALRAILRQDPEIIMVGEIRDFETVDIAIKSALTGHLVLSTLHTTTAVGAVVRMHNMGVEPFLISASLICTGAQRLIRRLCSHCREPYQPNAAMLEELGVIAPTDAPLTFYEPRGCKYCFSTGYSGRIGIMEVVPISLRIREQILKNPNELEICRIVREEKICSMRQNALVRVIDGITSLEEVLRTTVSDNR